MSDKESPYKRPRVIFMCSEETKESLKKWARREKRTVSNLIERIVDEAVLQETADPKHNPGNEALTFLRKLGTGNRPNTIERAALADSLEIDVEILDRLVDCIFETKHGVNHGS